MSLCSCKDARRQMLVSPPLCRAPPRGLRCAGRSVTVELGDSLMPDRTYIVQFGDAVRDLREANVAKGLQYVFTTGTAWTLAASPAVRDAWTGEASPGTRVMLFRRHARGHPRPRLARFRKATAGLCGHGGRQRAFDVGYLPIFAGVHGGRRCQWQLPRRQREAVAWSSEAIQTVTDSVDWAHLLAAPPLMLDAPPAVASTYLSGVLVDSSGYFRAAISGLDAVREGPDGLTDADIRDSVALTGPDGPVDFELEGDSVWASLRGYEAGEGGPWLLQHLSGTDTLVFREVLPNTPPVPVGAVERFADRGGHFRVRFAPRPVVLDTAMCSGMVVMDGDTSDLSPALFILDGNRLDVGPLPQGSTVALTIEPGGVQGVGGLSTDTLEWRVSVRSSSDYGAIQLLLDSAAKTQESEVIWLLLNGSGTLANRELNAAGRFEELLPGRYRLVMIWDENGDGKWSGARPAEGLHPEPVYRWADEIDIRAGWEVEIAPEFHPRP